MTTTDVDQVPQDPYPWDRPASAPTVLTTLHILADDPTLTFDGETYPSLTIRSGATTPSGTFHLILTGHAEERAAFAAKLREVAAAIAAWPSTVDEAEEDEGLPPATPEIVHDLLLLITERRDPEVIATWDQATLDEVAAYATAVHLRASDHDDVEVPAVPAVLDTVAV